MWAQRGLHAYGVVAGGRQGIERIMSGDVVGGVLDLVTAGISGRRLYQWSCFTGDMLIDVKEGRERADQVLEGDLVWMRNENDPNAPLKLGRVEEVFVRVSPVLNLHVAGQVIRTTAEHPFYVKDRSWWPAGELQAGQLIASRDNGWLEVEAVTDSGEVTTVYNFRVEEDHTYFVSANLDGLAVWAHNATRQYGGNGRSQSTVADNQNAGRHRENREAARLRRANRGASVQRERTLRDSRAKSS